MTDALMSLATEGLFAAKWTSRIETEWILSLERQRTELFGRLATWRDSMRDAVAGWEVPESTWAPVARGLMLPDPNDVHDLAS
jgi:hypothetical protein